MFHREIKTAHQSARALFPRDEMWQNEQIFLILMERLHENCEHVFRYQEDKYIDVNAFNSINFDQVEHWSFYHKPFAINVKYAQFFFGLLFKIIVKFDYLERCG